MKILWMTKMQPIVGWSVIIVFAIVFGFFVLALPMELSSRISSAAVAIGLILTAYGLYLNNIDAQKQAVKEDIDHTYMFWRDISNAFLENPELANVHQSIYGSDVPVKEHALYSIVAQAIQSMVLADRVNLLNINGNLRQIAKQWINTPNFRTFWQENKWQYQQTTQMTIDQLLASS